MRALAIFALVLFAMPAPTIAQTGTSTTATPPAAGEKVRCRSSVETGTLARRHRICRTVSEWRRLETREQDDANTLMDRSRAVPCGECRGPGGD